MPETTLPPAAARIRDWLAERIGHYLDRSVEEIDPSVSLTSYGLDSVCMYALSGDIEDELDLVVDPALLWDYDTADALTEYLRTRVEAA